MLNEYIKITDEILSQVKATVFIQDELLETLLDEFFKIHLKVNSQFFYEKKTLIAHLSQNQEFCHLIVVYLKEDMEEELEFLKQIKSFSNEAKILVILNYMQYSDIVKFFEEGADDIIFKPFTFGELRARLVRLLREYFLIQKLKKFLIEDPLTEVYNRRFFEDAIREETYRALRQKYPLTLFMIDLDNFKTYNDTLGHLKGDLLLKNIGQILNKSVRKGVDKVCRYGGDEFSIILPHIDWKNSIKIVNRIFENCKTQIDKTISLSVGIAQLIPKEDLDKTVSFLINRADSALYKAKEKKGFSWEVDQDSKKLIN